MIAAAQSCCEIAGVSLPGTSSCAGQPNGTVCGYTLYGSGNPVLDHFKDAEKGQSGYKQLQSGAYSNCQYYIKKCQNGTCTTDTSAPNSSPCTADVPNTSSPTCTGQ